MGKERPTISLREFFHVRNGIYGDSIDLDVEGTDCSIAVEFGDIKLTPVGEFRFGKGLDKLQMDGTVIVSPDKKDYSLAEYNMGALASAKELLKALAGQCSCTDYDKWFRGPSAKML